MYVSSCHAELLARERERDDVEGIRVDSYIRIDMEMNARLAARYMCE